MWGLKIEYDYDIGETVYLCHQNKIEKITINSITFKYTDNNLEIIYNEKYSPRELLTREDAIKIL